MSDEIPDDLLNAVLDHVLCDDDELNPTNSAQSHPKSNDSLVSSLNLNDSEICHIGTACADNFLLDESDPEDLFHEEIATKNDSIVNSLNFNESEICDIGTLFADNFKLEETDTEDLFHEEIAKKKPILDPSLKKVHVYRTYNEIISLIKNKKKFLCDRVRIMGVYKCAGGHYVQDRRSKQKLEIDLDAVEVFPKPDSTIFIMGWIKMKQITIKGGFVQVPVIVVGHWNTILEVDAAEEVFKLHQLFRPKLFEEMISLDDDDDDDDDDAESISSKGLENTECVNQMEIDECL